MADSTPLGPGVAFGRIAAAIPVSDISRAVGFYRDILGMSVAFINGDPVGFVILKRDAAELHRTLVNGHRGGSRNAAHLMVADAPASMTTWSRTGCGSSRGCAMPTTGCTASSSPTLTATASTSGRSCRPGHDPMCLTACC
jgi:hypothetical protein